MAAPTVNDTPFPLLALPDGLVDRIAYLLPPGDRWGAAAPVALLGAFVCQAATLESSQRRAFQRRAFSAYSYVCPQIVLVSSKDRASFHFALQTQG